MVRVFRRALLIVGLVPILLPGFAARAATLTVNSTADDTTAADGLVTLREAILAAESDGTTDLGETGSGPDTIVFDAALTATGDATITLATVGDTQFGPSAFVVTTQVTIQGPSGGRGISLARDGGVAKLRHFAVTSTGNLTLENLTLSDGRAIGGDGGTNLGDDGGGGGGGAGLGGAIYNQGGLVVRGSTLVANTAQGGAGGAASDNVGADSGGGAGGGGLAGNGGNVPDDGSDGGAGGGGTFGKGGSPVGGGGGGGGGGTLTDGSNGSGATGGAGGTLNGGAGGNTGTDGLAATGPGGGGGGGSDEHKGGAGDFGGGGGGTGENDSNVVQTAGAGGFGGGGGGGGEDNNGGTGGFGGGGGGASDGGALADALSAAGGFGAGSGGNFGAPVVNGAGGGGGGGGFGGAIFNHNGALTLSNSTVSGNSAAGGDGGAANGGSAGGDGEALGGGVFNLNGSVSLENATFADNSAGRGSDVFNLAHETTAGVTPAVAILSLKNTILDSSGVSNVENARLGADPGQAVVNGDATDILLASVVNNGGFLNDGGILITDPLLGSLTDNGGPTATHAPQFPGSPAIDAGDAGAATDQRGVARPQGPGFDIGSVEVPRFTGALAPGDLLLTEFYGGSVVDIQGGGDFTLAPRFAYGLDDPFGICTGPGSEVYVTEFFPGEVTVITAGGDFTSATAFATGLVQPVNLVCSDTQILVAEFGAGEVTDITAGGDFSAATPFAFGLGSLVGLFRDSGGTLWASNQEGRVHDITAGGDFSADPGFANMGGDLRGVTERGSALLVTSSGTDQVLDFSAGGDLSAAPVFATVPSPTEIVDLGPVGLFTPLEVPPVVYEISAGGDFTTAEPFATGLTTGGGFADLALIEGCGDGILDPATEECDDANLLGGDGCSATCTIRCAPAPAPMCNAAMAASVKLDERKSGREKLSASLKKVTGAVSQADFGDPVGGDTRFALCLYDGGGTLVLDLRVDRAGELCGTKQKPCWKALGMQGYGYKDGAAEADGVTKLVAKGGAAGKGSLSLQGRNNQPKGQTDLPTGAAALLAGETSATLQLLASDGACFGAALGVQKAADGQFKAKAP